MQMIKYFIWDFDGVLCDSEHLAHTVHNLIFRKYTGLVEIKNKSDYTTVIFKLMNRMCKDEVDKYYLEHRNMMYANYKQLTLFPVVEFIRTSHIPSVILTATYEKLVKEVLLHNNIPPEIFSKIIGRETPGTKKEKMLWLLKQCELNTNEIIYIGDSPSDVEFCQQLQVPIVVASYGYFSIPCLKSDNIVAICNSPENLWETLHRLIGRIE